MTVSGPSEATPRLGSREKALLLLLGIVAVLAVAFMLLVNLGGDDEDQALPTFTPTPRPTATETAEPDGVPPITPDGFEGRDPFQPLVVVGDGGGNGDVDGNGGVDGNGNGNGGPAPAPTSTARPADGDGETRTVTLLDIFTQDGERMATVSVDGQEFTVTEGETFADNFRLIELTEECGTFVFGDEQFTLCIGQEVRK